MKSIRGFVTDISRVNNIAGAVSSLFELSPLSLTYSKDHGEYQHNGYPGKILNTFKVKDQDTGTSSVLGDDEVGLVFEVMEAIRDYLANHAFPYDLNDLISTISAAFADRLGNFALGDLFVAQQESFPEWFSFTTLASLASDVRIWFRNEAFENQYTDYEIVAVPPIDALDRFFGSYAPLVAELGAITITQSIDRIQEMKDGYPETYLRVYDFNYYNPNNTAQKTPVRWGVLVYGKNGDNVDAIKDAIVAHVLTNSTHTLEEWKVIFPDIFRRTEFILYPRWDLVSIPNLTDTSSLYSTMADPVETLAFAERVWPTVAQGFLQANLNIIPFDYKAISVVCLNGESNITGKEKIKSIYGDYIPVSTSSLDFNRMSIATRNWVLEMVELIHVAETTTEFTSVQNPIRRVIREGVLYVTSVVDNVSYLVATKSNLR